MPQVIIKYEKPETLKILKELAKYFDVEIIEEKDNECFVKGNSDNTK